MAARLRWAPVGPNFGILDNASSTSWSPHSVLKDLNLVSISAQTHRASSSPSPIPFFHLLERLKTTKREGWRRFGIDHGESISDHMYRMSMITMLAPPSLSKKLDIPRCTQMALVHDLAESLVGDITPVDGVSKSEKSKREAATMDVLCDEVLNGVHDGTQSRHLKDLWQEYEDSKTLESMFVHDVDKLELMLQFVEYEHSSKGKIDLGEFTWVADSIKLPEMKAWSAQISQDRVAVWSDLGLVPNQGVTDDYRASELYREHVNGEVSDELKGEVSSEPH